MKMQAGMHSWQKSPSSKEYGIAPLVVIKDSQAFTIRKSKDFTKSINHKDLFMRKLILLCFVTLAFSAGGHCGTLSSQEGIGGKKIKLYAYPRLAGTNQEVDITAVLSDGASGVYVNFTIEQGNGTIVRSAPDSFFGYAFATVTSDVEGCVVVKASAPGYGFVGIPVQFQAQVGTTKVERVIDFKDPEGGDAAKVINQVKVTLEFVHKQGEPIRLTVEVLGVPTGGNLASFAWMVGAAKELFPSAGSPGTRDARLRKNVGTVDLGNSKSGSEKVEGNTQENGTGATIGPSNQPNAIPQNGRWICIKWKIVPAAGDKDNGTFTGTVTLDVEQPAEAPINQRQCPPPN
jgi:hypothetical protein